MIQLAVLVRIKGMNDSWENPGLLLTKGRNLRQVSAGRLQIQPTIAARWICKPQYNDKITELVYVESSYLWFKNDKFKNHYIQ